MALPDDVCTVCDAVLSQRSCLADGKRHRGRIREAALAGRPCPFGCKLRGGEPAPFTWVHAQIFCSQKELVSRRRTFAEAIDAAELAWASGKADHMQMSQVKRLVTLGLPAAGTRNGAVAAERPLQSYEERDLRAFVGGLVKRTMDKHADASSEYRAALVKAVVAGARVQQKAHELTAEIEAEVEQTVRGLTLARRYAARWRRATVEAGPARAAALRAARVSHALACEQVVSLAMDGLCTADEAEAMIVYDIDLHVCAAIREARERYPPRGDEAYRDWRWLWRLRRWRLRAALRAGRGERGGGDGAIGEGASTLDVAASAWVTEAVAIGVRPAMPDSVATFAVHAPIGQVRSIAATQAQLATIGLIEREHAAWSRWQFGGGAKGERMRARKARDERARRALARLGAAFRRYMAQSGGARIGMSGAALDDVGARVDVVIGPRARSRGRKRRRGGGGHGDGGGGGRVTGTRIFSDFQRGAAADRHGRWKVERVLEVRRVGDGRRRRLEMRIRWAGADPATDLPWADEWRPMADANGRVPNAALNAEARRMEALKYGRRLPMPPPPPPERARQLRVRTRSEDDDGEELVRQPARRPRRPGAVIED